MPQNISSAKWRPECVLCHMDNVLIYGHTQQDHDSRLHKALRMIQKAGVTLNKKCKFNQSRITFLGHVIDGNGVTADPRRPLQLWPWRNLRLGTKLRRSMGMINQLCKFTPNTADLSQQLRASELQESMDLGSSSRQSIHCTEDGTDPDNDFMTPRPVTRSLQTLLRMD